MLLPPAPGWMQNMPSIFVSYVRENRQEVDRLAAELREYGIRVWLDRDSIHPGSWWKDAIRRSIAAGDFFLACFSKEYALRQTTQMNEELLLAVEQIRLRPLYHTWFIPVLLSPCAIPEYPVWPGATLRDIQAVSLFENWEEGVERLLSTVRPDPGTKVSTYALNYHLGRGRWSEAARMAVSLYDRDGQANQELIADLLSREPGSRDTKELLRVAYENRFGFVIDRLIGFSTSHPDDDVRRFSLGLLVTALSEFQQCPQAPHLAGFDLQRRREAAEQAIVSAVSDVSTSVRTAAIRAVFSLRISSGEGKLLACLNPENPSKVIIAAICAVGDLKLNAAGDLLLTLLSRTDDNVCWYAADALARLGRVDALPMMMKLFVPFCPDCRAPADFCRSPSCDDLLTDDMMFNIREDRWVEAKGSVLEDFATR